VPVVPTFTPEFVDKKPVEFSVKQCYNKCAAFDKSSDTDFATCLLGCFGGQKPEKVDSGTKKNETIDKKPKAVVVVEPIVSARKARGYEEYKECVKKCYAENGGSGNFSSCPITCVFR
jgi:hypothetical protein